MEKGKSMIKQNRKGSILTTLATVIKKDLTTSIRKSANKMKVHKKTVMTAIR